jgi:hypothetical protein
MSWVRHGEGRGNHCTLVLRVRYTPSSYPSLGFRGDIEDTVLSAGEACGLIHDLKPAA